MVAEHSRMMKPAGQSDPPTDAEFEAMKDRIRGMNLPDVKI